ncbi:hypothetical protein ACFLU4_04450 [Chloroflexota bacterium]
MLVAVATSTILFWGTSQFRLFPHGFAFMMLPLIFYFYIEDYKRLRWNNRLLLIIFLAFQVFVYPPIGLTITISFIGIELARWIFGQWHIPILKRSVWVGPIIISFIVFYMWSSGFPSFSYSIQQSFEWLSGEVISVPVVNIARETIVPQGPFEFISMVLKIYGDNFALIFISIATSAFVTKWILKGKTEMWPIAMTVVSFFMCSIAAIALFMLILAGTVGRLLSLSYAMWVVPTLAGFGIYSLFRNKINTSIFVAFSVLITMWVISVAGLYPSPFTSNPGAHVTHMAVAGDNWLFRHSSSTTIFVPMGYEVNLAGYSSRYIDGIPTRAKIKTVSFGDSIEGIPDHFGYQENGQRAHLLSERFILISQGFRDVSILYNMRNSPLYAVSSMGSRRFNESDFQRLDFNASLDRLYSNNETEIWYVSQLARPE